MIARASAKKPPQQIPEKATKKHNTHREVSEYWVLYIVKVVSQSWLEWVGGTVLHSKRSAQHLKFAEGVVVVTNAPTIVNNSYREETHTRKQLGNLFPPAYSS